MTSSSPRAVRPRRLHRLAAALVVASGLVASALSAPSVARAQPRSPTAEELETARTLYKEGKELRARGDLRGALEKLQAAHALGNTPVTGIELARTYAMVGQIAEAREVCLYVARLPVAPDETEKSADARADAAKLAEELRPRIPTLAVKPLGAGPGEVAHLSIDGVAIPEAAVGEPQKVDPGKHVVEVRVGEGARARTARQEATVAEGQSAELVVPVAPPPSTEHAAAAPSGGAGTALVRAGFATAIAGGAIGILTGATAWNKKNQLGTECNQSKECDATHGAQDLDTARTWGNVSTVAFSVGAAGLVVGVVGLFVSKGESAKGEGDRHEEAGLAPWFGAGTAGVHGRF
jgi:hypothetical protein